MKTQPDEIIRQLEETNSRLDKEAILEAAVDEQLDLFFDGLRLALNPLVVFGIKKVPFKAEAEGQGLPWEAFHKLQAQLSTRELTGHDARDAVQLACDVATQRQWNDWYRRILQKDLKCGVSEKTVNKVCKKKGVEHWGVPVFACQLAHDAANHEKKVSGKKQIEIKLDGVRVITLITQDSSEFGWKVEQFSRNGKLFENFGHITGEIEAVIRRSPPPYALVLDGEVMSANFQDLMKQVHRKEGAAAGDAVLHLFDTVPYNEWRNGGWDKPQSFRSEITRAWVEQNSDLLEHVEALDWETVDLDTDQGRSRFVELNRRAVDGGYEGVMIKDPDAAYENKRTHAWLKQKPFIEVSLKVDAVEEGTGRNEGRLGAFVCSGREADKEIRVNVGSGFTDQQRTQFWENREELSGSIVEVRADAITSNQDGTYSLRFPRFKTFRGFETGEKI